MTDIDAAGPGRPATILLVCSGNLCRSPLAEAIMRRRLVERLGEEAPTVRSAGTIAFTGASATPEGVRVAAELGLDTTAHAATRLRRDLLGQAELIVAMAAEHRDRVARLDPGAASKTFTLKELVRLLEEHPVSAAGPAGERPLVDRVALANDRRRGSPASGDEDIVDPIGQPIETYRAVAWELTTWIDRFVDAMFGPADRGGVA